MKLTILKSFSIGSAFLVTGLAAYVIHAQSLTNAEMEEKCYENWKDSTAATTCSDPYDTPGNWGGIQVHPNESPFQCTLKSACPMSQGLWATAYKGPADDFDDLLNCEGDLKLSCS